MNKVEVTTWYLDYQGSEPQQVSWPKDCQLVEAKVACPELNQFMFRAVGSHWRWFSRLSWNYQQWLDYLTAGNVRTWLLHVQGTPAGYMELIKHTDLSVEIKFFGLLPQFVGKGLGNLLAKSAVYQASCWQASRIWLHTCSADHPSALTNYQKAGFVITKTEQDMEVLPEHDDPRLLSADFVYSSLQYHAKSAG